MNFIFRMENKELVMTCESEMWNADSKPFEESIREEISEKGYSRIKRCFTITVETLRESEVEHSLSVCIGRIQDDFIKLDKDVFDIDIEVFISVNKASPLRDINEKMFIASSNISILQKINDIINNDFYIVNADNLDRYQGEGYTAISLTNFKKLIRRFPNTTELKKYTRSRISSILKEELEGLEEYEEKFQNYLQKYKAKQNVAKLDSFSSALNRTELAKFEVIEKELSDMLSDSNANEQWWEERIAVIIRFMYPKYVYSKRQYQIKTLEGIKKPDFVMVDANGYIDLMEIKRPETQIMKKNVYRGN